MKKINARTPYGEIIATLRDESDQSVFEEIFKDRLYRAAEPILKQAKTIIDVGAHIGFFAIYARALNPAAKIFCLEPEPENFVLLEKNLQQNKIKAKIFQTALSADEKDETDLYISENSHNHTTVQSNLKSIKVKAVTVSNFFAKNKIIGADVVKLDIEGGEFPILSSWDENVYKKIKSIVMEYHEDKNHKAKTLEDILGSNGFSIQKFVSPFDKRFGLLIARNKRKK